MPDVLILLALATAFAVVLCLVLWLIAEATGGAAANDLNRSRTTSRSAGARRGFGGGRRS